LTHWFIDSLVGGAVGHRAIAFVIWELRSREPIVDLTVLVNRNFAVGTSLMIVMGDLHVQQNQSGNFDQQHCVAEYYQRLRDGIFICAFDDDGPGNVK